MRPWLSRVAVMAAAFILAGGAWAQTAFGAGLHNLPLLQDGQSKRSSSSDPDWKNGNADARPIPPGETLVLGELEGPGVINHFWNTIASDERGYSRLLILRMYWDGEEHPSVECPIGDFFGIGHGIDRAYQSLPVKISSDGRARNCYWPMPFRKSARITVTNEGRKPTNAFYYYLDWEKVSSLPEDTAYFHAMYRQEFPTISGQNYLLADIEGRGHYVGTVLSVHQHTGSWFGEGDDFFFIDGESEPSIRGTGTEDYFCDAWGFREQDGPYYGTPLWQGYQAGDYGSAYRWHITDPVRFTKSLRVEIEHKGVTFNEDGSVKSGFEERTDDFSSVAFWYQAEPHKPWPAIPAGYERLYYDIANVLEGESLVSKATATEGAITTQKIGNLSGGAQLFWTPTTENQSITISFEVSESGLYGIIMLLTKSWDYGVFQVEIDGRPLGEPVDLYKQNVVSEERFFAPQTLEAGSHNLVFRNVGKNKASEGVYFGLDGVLLTKQP